MAISFFFSVLLILKHHSVSRVCVLPLLKWARNSIASLMPFVLGKPQWAGQCSLVLFLRPVYSGRLPGLKSEKFIYILPTGGYVTPLKASVDRWKWQQHSISKLLFQELAWWPWGSHTKCSPVSCVLMTEMEIVWNGNMSWRKTYENTEYLKQVQKPRKCLVTTLHLFPLWTENIANTGLRSIKPRCCLSPSWNFRNNLNVLNFCNDSSYQ